MSKKHRIGRKIAPTLMGKTAIRKAKIEYQRKQEVKQAKVRVGIFVLSLFLIVVLCLFVLEYTHHEYKLVAVGLTALMGGYFSSKVAEYVAKKV